MPSRFCKHFIKLVTKNFYHIEHTYLVNKSSEFLILILLRFFFRHHFWKFMLHGTFLIYWNANNTILLCVFKISLYQTLESIINLVPSFWINIEKNVVCTGCFPLCSWYWIISPISDEVYSTPYILRLKTKWQWYT